MEISPIMRKLLVTSLGLMAGFSAFPQGNFNASNNYIPPGATEKAFILDGRTGLPLSKTVGKVQIINAIDGVTLSPLGDAGVALPLDGLFFINGLIVPGVPTGGTAYVIVRAWDSTTGDTWADAGCRSAPNSGLVTVNNLSGGAAPPATFRDDSNFVGLQVCPIPEPPTIALAVLGIAGLFLFGRREKPSTRAVAGIQGWTDHWVSLRRSDAQDVLRSAGICASAASPSDRMNRCGVRTKTAR